MKHKRETHILVSLLLFCSVIGLHGQSVQLSHPPGEYKHSVLLEMETDLDEQLYYRFSDNTHFVPYSFPLHLSALSGEERNYRIEVSDSPVPEDTKKLEVFEYRIDKRIPEAPEIEPKEGVYSGSVKLSFRSGKDAIFFSLSDSASSTPRLWRGEDIVLQPREEPYRVSAYARDSAGNLSNIAGKEYTVRQNSAEKRHFFDILSPAEGVFHNQQLLYVKSEGLSEFLYTTDGSDPRRSGKTFYGATMLDDLRGNITLSVAGKLSDGQYTDVKTLRFSVLEGGDDNAVSGIPLSGVYREEKTLDFSVDPVFYTFEERRPTKEDPLAEGVLNLPAPQGLEQHYALRFVSRGSIDGTAHYRCFYVFDTRKPVAPVITVSGSAPYAEAPLVSILAPDTSRIHYTLDGSDPDAGSPVYSGPFIPPVPESEGSLIIKARIVSEEGVPGPVAGRLIPYDLVPPEPPKLRVGELNRAGSLRIQADVSGDAIVVFETGDNESSTPNITVSSPVWSGEDLHIPWGMSTRRFFRFASRDSAGNLSDPVTVLTELHRLPPPAPRIDLEHDQVHITGSGKLFYSLATRGRDTTTEGDYIPFEEPFTLEGEAEQLVLYRIQAFAEDVWGNRSSIAGYDFRIDERLPELPGIIGLEDRRVYKDAVLLPRFSSHEDDLDVVYSLGTDSQEPPDPGFDSPSLKDLEIETEEGSEVYYQLKLLPVFPERGRVGRITTLRFVVDRKAPEIPEIHGIPRSGISAEDVVLTLGDFPENESAYILISEKSDSQSDSDPLLHGEEYIGPRRIGLQDGQDRTFIITLSMLDAAGNRMDMEKPLQVRIDRSPPLEPEISGIPENGINSSPLRLDFRAPEDAGVEYRIVGEGDVYQEGTIPFVPYEETLELSAPDGELRVFQLEYRSFDEAGNRSRNTLRDVVTIDRRPAASPGEPQVEYQGGASALISWSVAPGATLLYRFEGQPDWSVYSSPLSIDPSSGKGASSIQYYLRNEYGITTPVETLRLKSAVREGGGSLVRGAEKGAVYPGQVVLEPQLSSDKGFVRYELGIDSQAPELGPHSPIMEEKLVLNVPAGMERRYSLRSGFYPLRESRVPQTEEYLEFTIDRLGPRAPLLIEGVSGDSDARKKTIELEADGNRILYSLDGSEPQKEYAGAIRLDVREESGRSVPVRAVAYDQMGNRSRIMEWTVFLDQDIIYVSENGNDLFEGSRLRPFRTLHKALEQAGSLNRGSIYIAEGSYTVQQPLVIPGKTNLIGGLDQEDWQPEGRSIIQSGEYFPRGREILSIESDSSIQGLLFSDPHSRTSLPIRVQGANVELKDIDTAEGSSFEYLLRQKDGVITLRDSVIYRGARRGIFLNHGGSLNIEDTTLTVTGDIDGDWAAVTMKGGSLSLRHSSIRPGMGTRTSAVDGEDAYISLQETELYSGTGSRSAIALRIVRGQVRISGGSLRAVEAQTPIAVSADAARLEIRETGIKLGGRNGNTGLVLTGSELTMRNCDVSTEEEAGFSFMLRQQGGSSELLNCTASVSARGEPVLIDLEGGRLSMIHSSLLVSSSRERPSGIISRAGAQLFLTNSIVSNARGPSGTAVRGEKEDAWSIRNCNFGDWARIAEYGGRLVPDAEAMNNLDGDPLGGWIDANIAESPRESFIGESYRLKENSACVNAGIESGAGFPDMDGQKRPNPSHGIRPFPDIGADEFYPVP